MSKRLKGKHVFSSVGAHIIVIVVALAFVFPLIWVFMTTFKTPREYYSMPPVFFPKRLHLIHYAEAFVPWTIDSYKREHSESYFIEESAGRVDPVTPNIFNSLIIVVGAVGLSLLVGMWAAYALSRFRFRGSEDLQVWILSIRMMPPIVIAVPLFWMIRSLRIHGTHFGLMTVYVLLNLPFVVWMMKGFFDAVPKELEESAFIDGGNRWTVIFRVSIPIAFNGIIATALFCVYLTWTEFLFASILTNKFSATLPVVLSAFRQDRGILWGQMSAVIIVALIPIIIMTILLQKQMIKGLAAGALK
jgi:multiple sugar transport system permease protein